MSLFYKPFTTVLSQVPVIIYPMKGIESLVARSNPDSIVTFLKDLYTKQPSLQSGVFHIVILWCGDGELMTDAWVYRELESNEAGYTIDYQTFRGVEMEKGAGITASDGLIMLGRETELEESLRLKGKSIEEYVFGVRPTLPDPLNPTESYCL